ncbi:hypothetical protein FQN57_000004 [Myotisia sp. PD_48]|nr:hypothetical protein FQN57_000004 [Myotisia sp. PD_48]
MASLNKSAWKIIPEFRSTNIRRTVAFYTESLHFTLGGTHPEDENSVPIYCSVFMGKKAEANIHFFDETAPTDSTKKSSQDEKPFVCSSAKIALGTTELDEYYELLKQESKVNITQPIEDTPWGWRHFTVADPDGNTITFFKFLEGGNPGTE